MSFFWYSAGAAMTGRELLGLVQELDAADRAALDSTIELTYPDVQDPWSVGHNRHSRSVITLAPNIDSVEDDDTS